MTRVHTDTDAHAKERAAALVEAAAPLSSGRPAGIEWPGWEVRTTTDRPSGRAEFEAADAVITDAGLEEFTDAGEGAEEPDDDPPPPAHAVTSIVPNHAVFDVPTQIVVTGVGLADTSYFRINGAITPFTVNSDTQITATTPTMEAGQVGPASSFPIEGPGWNIDVANLFSFDDQPDPEPEP